MLRKKIDFSLKSHNTFGIDVKATEVLFVSSVSDLKQINELDACMILGGGSNILFTSDLSKRVVINEIKGIETIEEDDDHVWLKIASGENWHELVLHCVEKGFGGIENMSLIPGSVGAAPMQNIGAYGAEIKDVLISVGALDLKTKQEVEFSNAECEFGYRESVFKKRQKGNYFITHVILKLTKRNHKLNTSYGAIQEVLAANNIEQASIKNISDAVIQIRQSKLPDPAELGNAGSFFKNPIISTSHFNNLKEKFPDIKSYPVDDEHVKVPAGWLIESLGWKGKRVGNTGSHQHQALVLVNYGGVEGAAVKALSEEIKASVWDTYKIPLETEVNIIE